MDLLERGPHLTALREYAADAAAGRGRLVLVSGEAGVGKSALIGAFRDRSPDLRWLEGACDGLFTPRPLGPLLDLAEQLGGELLTLCRRPDVPREQLFWALLRALGEAEDLPTVLVVEDLHWADRATLDLVHFLARRLDRARLMLVLSYRDDASHGAPDVDTLLGDVVRLGCARRLTVPPLTRHAVLQMTARSGMAPDELYRLTGGNAFFLTELLSVVSRDLPPTARAAVLSRVAGLSPRARHVLDALALLGTRVRLDVLGSVVPITSADLDELVGSGAVHGDGEEVGFRHEIARMAVAAAVPAHRAAELHRRALAVLERQDAEDHAEGAHDGDAVLRHALPAARTASRLGSHREAVEQYERALRHTPDTPSPERADLLLALLVELGLVDRWHDACTAGEQALAIYEESHDPVGSAATLGWLGRAYWRTARGAEASASAERAVALLEPLGPSQHLAAALASLAGTLMTEGAHDAAVATARRARAMAGPDGDPAVLAAADNAEACALANAGRPWRGLMERSLRISLDHGLHSDAGRAYANLANLYQSDLRMHDALAVAAEGTAYTRDHDVGTYARCIRGAEAEALEQLGRWDDAVTRAREVLAANACPENRIQSLLVLSRVLLRRGDPGAADLLDEALDVATGVGDPQFVVPARIALAEASWLRGDLVTAREQLTPVLGTAAGAEPVVRGQVVTWAARLGMPRPGLEDIAAPYAEQLTDPRSAAGSWDALGIPYAAHLARVDAGDEESLREAVTGLDRLGARAAADRARQLMRQGGARSVPAGARRSTRDNPHGLTAREQDVLDQVVAGLANPGDRPGAVHHAQDGRAPRLARAGQARRGRPPGRGRPRPGWAGLSKPGGAPAATWGSLPDPRAAHR